MSTSSASPRFTITFSGNRISALNHADALALCGSKQVPLTAQVVEHTSLGDRVAPLAHYRALYRAALGQEVPVEGAAGSLPRRPWVFLVAAPLFCAAMVASTYQSLSNGQIASGKGRSTTIHLRSRDPDLYWLNNGIQATICVTLAALWVNAVASKIKHVRGRARPATDG